MKGLIKMNNKKIFAVLAALPLLTGCGAFNNSESDQSDSVATYAQSPTDDTKDCCADKEKDCCSEPADCCGDSAEAVLGKPEKTDINIGYLNSTAHLLAFVAAEEGYFKEEGLNVVLTQFSSASELVNGLESDKLDVAFIGSVPTLTFASQGHEISVFGGAMTNGHGYVIKPEFTDKDEAGVEVLKGRNVASVKNSVQDAELQILLRNAGIEIGEGEDKVNIVYFDSQKDAYAALLNKNIDAASAYSPYTSLAKSQGYRWQYWTWHCFCGAQPRLPYYFRRADQVLGGEAVASACPRCGGSEHSPRAGNARSSCKGGGNKGTDTRFCLAGAVQEPEQPACSLRDHGTRDI